MKIQKTETGDEIILLEPAKKYLQATDYDDEDELIIEMIKAARDFIENFCGISLVDKSIVLDAVNYPVPFQIPYGPVKNISVINVDDVDVSATDTGADGYIYTTGTKLRLEYTAGYNVTPPALINAMYRIMRIFYEQRDAETMTSFTRQVPNVILTTLEKYSRNLFI